MFRRKPENPGAGWAAKFQGGSISSLDVGQALVRYPGAGASGRGSTRAHDWQLPSQSPPVRRGSYALALPQLVAARFALCLLARHRLRFVAPPLFAAADRAAASAQQSPRYSSFRPALDLPAILQLRL